MERVGAYVEAGFRCAVPERGRLAGRDASGQFSGLSDLLEREAAIREEAELNHRAVFLNYPFWENSGRLEADGERVLEEVRPVWSEVFHEAPLEVP